MKNEKSVLLPKGSGIFGNKQNHILRFQRTSLF